MSFPKHIFKAYDIRGLADGEISPELAYRVGRAFVAYLRESGRILEKRSIVVGRDMRKTSPLFQFEVMRGITDEGVDVVDIGLATTPLFNFACAHYPEHAGGIMVTASHNPSQYNGFKMTLEDGLPVGKGNGMEKVRDLAEANQFVPAARKGEIRPKEILEDYLKRIFNIVKPDSIKPLKVVIDAGNGMAKVTIPEVLERLNIRAEYLYLEPDGRFPNHEANPLKAETLRDLQKKVVESGADFGFALDGDADRVGLVDEAGSVVDASFVGALVGLEVLRENPGALLLYDLRSSAIVPEVWKNAGGKTAICMVGHANIKKEMKVRGAVFASELSLHLYYKTMYDVESSDLSLLYVLSLLSREGKPLSRLIAPLKKYFHSGEINFNVKNAEKIMTKIADYYKTTALEISRMDGLWMRFSWGWFSLRASNTEPVMRLNLETVKADMKEKKISELSSLVNS